MSIGVVNLLVSQICISFITSWLEFSGIGKDPTSGWTAGGDLQVSVGEKSHMGIWGRGGGFAPALGGRGVLTSTWPPEGTAILEVS